MLVKHREESDHIIHSLIAPPGRPTPALAGGGATGSFRTTVPHLLADAYSYPQTRSSSTSLTADERRQDSRILTFYVRTSPTLTVRRALIYKSLYRNASKQEQIPYTPVSPYLVPGTFFSFFFRNIAFKITSCGPQSTYFFGRREIA